jgi:hypothetical protein
MSSQKTNIPALQKVYNTTAKSLKENLALFIPFIVFALVESLVLIIIYLAPRAPLRSILGPVIRTFWGEKFLHYPTNFLLLPKLSSLARMGLSVVIGSLLTGMAVAMIFDIYHKKHPRLSAALKAALKKYISLFTIVLITTFSYYFLVKAIAWGLLRYFIAGHNRLLFLRPRLWMGPILSVIVFILAVLIQSAFTYAIPILIIEKEKLVESIIKSFGLYKKFFLRTLLLVGLPMLTYIPILVLIHNAAFLINTVFPEYVLLVLFIGLIMSALVIDVLVTVSTAWFYLLNKEKD